MTNVGIVKSVKGNMAKVFVGAGSETTRWIETEAINPVNAKVGGEKVRVNMKSLAFLKKVSVLYVLPIVALLTSAVLGRVYLPHISGGQAPTYSLHPEGFSCS